MSASFYNSTTSMVGIDLHTYLIAAGPAPAPSPMHPHVVAQVMKLGDATNGLVHDVTADSFSMVKRGCRASPMLHVPLPVPPPHPAEVVQLVVVCAAGSSKAVLGVASVTAHGTPLACAVWWIGGTNKNCGDGFPLLDGTLTITSVKTQPTLADFVAAIADVTVDFLIEHLVPFHDFLKRLFGDALEQPLKELAKPIVSRIMGALKDGLTKPRPISPRLKRLVSARAGGAP